MSFRKFRSILKASTKYHHRGHNNTRTTKQQSLIATNGAMAPDEKNNTSSIVMEYNKNERVTHYNQPPLGNNNNNGGGGGGTNNSDDWESSYSDVEISIESDRAMTEGETSSSSSSSSSSSDDDDEDDSESSFEDMVVGTGGQYEELVEDSRDGSGEFVAPNPQSSEFVVTEDLFARPDAPNNNNNNDDDNNDNDDDDDDDNNNANHNSNQLQQQYPNRYVEERTATTTLSNRHLKSPSQSGNRAVDKHEVVGSPNRRIKSHTPMEAPSLSKTTQNYNHDDGNRRNRGAVRNNNNNNNNNNNGSSSDDRERMHPVNTPVKPTDPTDSEDFASPSRTKSDSKPSSSNSLYRPISNSNSKSNNSLQKQPTSSSSNNSNNNNIHTSHKSIKIPALHNNKQEGDDDYIQRKIQQENNRRSRSLSRSENSGSSGLNHSHSSNRYRNRTRTSRSRSNSKHGRQKHQHQHQHQGTESNHKQFGSGGGNSVHGSSSSTSSSKSNHQQRTAAENPAPRRILSIHTSTPTDEMTGSTKHSNHDGSKRVSWKSDPKASFSDWTLHVVYRDAHNKRRIDVYHVHRNVVGFGHRKSNFLLRDIMRVELQDFVDFDTNNQTEVELQELLNSGNNTTKNKSKRFKKDTIITRLKLPSESQARSVPMVLDFMYYTNETKQRMSADRSCNVFKVAEGLEVQALQKAIGEFYMKNLSLKNLGEFLTAATKVKADKLLTICKAKIGQTITIKPELSAMVPPKFMAEILSVSSKQLNEARKKEPQKYTDDAVVSQSKYWSRAACICASQNEAVMTPKLFQKLTSEESLPYIDVSATPQLLSMESTFLEGRKNGRKQLTSLQRRCVESIGEDFDAFQECFDSHQEIAESLKHLPSNILSEILMKLLTRP